MSARTAPAAGMANAAAVLEAQSLSLGYGRAPHVVEGLDLALPHGEFVAIIGPNGCGKSTLLRAFANLLPPAEGRLIFDGRELHERTPRELARELGLLSQINTAPEGVRVSELVARGRHPHRGFLQGWTEADERAVRDAMAATGITDLGERELDTLSGGQAQRVWLAMALAQDTHTLLLDEPTTYLDIAHQLDALSLFRRINRQQHRTVIAVLHEINHAARYADRIIGMRDGRVVLNGPPRAVLTPDGVRDVFDLECVVIDDPVSATPLIVPRERP